MPGRRLDFIDGVRAIAVILVFLVHAPEVFRPIATGGRWMFDVSESLHFGRTGVVAFFAVSGFVIPSSFHRASRNPLLDFAISRLFRLLPAYWVSILPSALLIAWMSGGAISGADVALNFTMLPRLFHAAMANGAYWTLEVELAFYAIAAFLFYAGLLENLVVLSSFMFVPLIVFLSSQHPMLGGLLNPRLASDTFYFWLHVSVIFWGACCRRIWDGERPRALPGLMIGAFAGYWLAYFPIHALLLHPIARGVLDPNTAYSAGAGLFLSAVLLKPHWGKLLRGLGRISYSFYLLHGPAVYGVAWVVGKAGWHARMEPLCAAGFALSWAAAALSFRGIEAPAVRIGRRLSRHWAAAAPAVVAE